MSESENVKVIRPSAVFKPKVQDKAKLIKFYLVGLVGVSLGFVLLLALVSFLPVAGYIKITSLLLGAFLILDIHHSLKCFINKAE
jgi:putative flippase GtrA